MNIPEIRENLKGLIRNDEIFTIALVLLVGVASFGLGRASVSGLLPQEREEAGIIMHEEKTQETKASEWENQAGITSTETTDVAGEGYVASKSGTKYHLPWCGGAKSIKEENKIWFKTKEEAEAAGYTPAANCKGI